MIQPVTLPASSSARQPLFVDFINTRHAYEGVTIELIGDEEELSEWLAEHDLPPAYPATRVATLFELRASARGIAEAIAAGRAVAEVDIEALNRALGEPNGRVALLTDQSGHARLAFRPEDADADPVTFQVALSIAHFLEFGDRHRLKLCANPGCDFVFLDTSRNNTRRWCYMRYCGNRFKVQAFRRRKQASARTDGG